MNFKKLLPSISFVIIFFFPAITQEDYTLDRAFFKAQEVTYQRWLEDAGLGRVLRVQEVEVDPDIVSLYLKFNYSDIDSMYSAFIQLQEDYDNNHEISLKQQLFYKFIHMMDIPESDCNVQIYDTYVGEKFCLYWGIYFDDGIVQMEHKHDCDRASIMFDIDQADFSKSKEITADSIQNRLSKGKVFKEILKYARNRFEVETCPDRDPTLRVRETKNVLRFEADDLCREVLIDETNNVLCRIATRLRFSCSTIKRERLNFTFTYEPTDEGFKISCEIDGKYASGYLGRKPLRGDYKDMEEGEFKEYLELFADLLVQDLRKTLVRL